MPTVRFNDRDIECEAGERLRDVLLRAGETPHNGNARWMNCRGLATCGTCAVEVVRGEVPPRNAREERRLGFPPHDAEGPLRLACQLPVQGDLEVRKYPGFWGQKTSEPPVR